MVKLRVKGIHLATVLYLLLLLALAKCLACVWMESVDVVFPKTYFFKEKAKSILTTVKTTTHSGLFYQHLSK